MDSDVLCTRCKRVKFKIDFTRKGRSWKQCNMCNEAQQRYKCPHKLQKSKCNICLEKIQPAI